MPKTTKAKPRARREAAIPLKERTYYCVICNKAFTPEKWNQKTCCGAHANELERRKHREKTAVKVEELLPGML